jgi:hypothetical protein
VGQKENVLCAFSGFPGNLHAELVHDDAAQTQPKLVPPRHAEKAHRSAQIRASITMTCCATVNASTPKIARLVPYQLGDAPSTV